MSKLVKEKLEFPEQFGIGVLNHSKKRSVWLCGYVMKQDNEVFIFNAYLYNAPHAPLSLPYSLPHVADVIS